MASNLFHVLICLSSLSWSSCSDLDDVGLEHVMAEDHWVFRGEHEEKLDPQCAAVKPSRKDIVKRFYAILPYLDKDHANSHFLHKFRATVNVMAETDDNLDREAAFYAAVLTPIIFLQQYRDTWCLLERFQRAMRLFQVSHPTEKRSALKLLQNLRDINSKVRTFISNFPGPTSPSRINAGHNAGHNEGHNADHNADDEEFKEKKDIRYLKELIKNLG